MDEFDDLAGPSRAPTMPGSAGDALPRRRAMAARLVSRLYRAANEPLRADMLARLLRPLGTLSLVAVASGAFARFLPRHGGGPDQVSLDDVASYSSDQIRELAHFVHEVNPDAVQQVGRLLADNAVGFSALSASALLLLYRRWLPASRPSPRPAAEADGAVDQAVAAAAREPR
jgi:hypothetical protein